MLIYVSTFFKASIANYLTKYFRIYISSHLKHFNYGFHKFISSELMESKSVLFHL